MTVNPPAAAADGVWAMGATPMAGDHPLQYPVLARGPVGLLACHVKRQETASFRRTIEEHLWGLGAVVHYIHSGFANSCMPKSCRSQNEQVIFLVGVSP